MIRITFNLDVWNPDNYKTAVSKYNDCVGCALKEGILDCNSDKGYILFKKLNKKFGNCDNESIIYVLK